ncbi:mechanosensitive ion channel family protein [Aquimarina latercula]|uniref:mechanosensitive ion channel family protein n=1 Tax=Aquimarina latercula TaxID=987 RepID=UPI0003FD870D|nr:mechanosensitive ion channel domain-containing protein [Aquimarina latercula]
MQEIKDILNYTFHLGKEIQITVQAILILTIIFVLTSIILRLFKKLVTRKLTRDDSRKFSTVFSFVKYFIFLIVTFITLDNIGVNITAIFAASAALLIGVGLALQTLFQDIICGIFVLLDKTVHVGDIIEIDDKVVRVTDINLRTTRGINLENKVLVIPNHTYLTNTLYNWTQNNNITRENVTVGVAYGSDTKLVKKLLLEAAKNTEGVLEEPEPTVFFTEFADSSLNFKLVFTVNDSFQAVTPKSDLHFEIDRLFRENKVAIPFPQRDIHIINHNKGE